MAAPLPADQALVSAIYRSAKRHLHVIKSERYDDGIACQYEIQYSIKLDSLQQLPPPIQKQQQQLSAEFALCTIYYVVHNIM